MLRWFNRSKRPKPRTVSTAPVGPLTGKRFALMHELARVGPITLTDVVTTKPNGAARLVERERTGGVWTCDDLGKLAPDVPVKRQFPTKANLLDTVFAMVPEREYFNVKRDGVPGLVVMMLEPTFEVMARNIRFRYLAKHRRDSDIVIIVVQSWLRPLDK